MELDSDFCTLSLIITDNTPYFTTSSTENLVYTPLCAFATHILLSSYPLSPPASFNAALRRMVCVYYLLLYVRESLVCLLCESLVCLPGFL